MKKSTVLSLTTAAVILAAYVPNEVVLAETSSSEDAVTISDKEKVAVDKETENKEKHEDIHNAIETLKHTEEKKTTIIEEKEVVSKNPVIDNNTSNEEAKIKEQTRKLSAGCSKHCFEVVDRADEVSDIYTARRR